MSWSIKPSLIRTEPPHVLWNETFLRQLSDDDFRAAIIAANALGDDTVTNVSEGRGAIMVPEATLIVGAIIKEMSRRGWDSTDEVGPSDPTQSSEGGVAGSAANKSRQPISTEPTQENP